MYLTLSVPVWMTSYIRRALDTVGYLICICNEDFYDKRINNIGSLYACAEHRPLPIYSLSNFSDTELTQ